MIYGCVGMMIKDCFILCMLIAERIQLTAYIPKISWALFNRSAESGGVSFNW